MSIAVPLGACLDGPSLAEISLEKPIQQERMIRGVTL
jgi:hypothetical protein